MIDYWVWGGGLRPELPDRVRTVIRTQQEESEKLIGWIQLTIVSVFAVLYIISPKQFMPDGGLRLVPVIFTTYFIFTFLRLYLVYRGALPGWFVGLSVIADIVLLLVTIWSFHLQYMQPPSFYLKAPTLLYIFIFIALRALRFEARFVVLAGLVAALGWVVMFGYVIVAEPGNPMITRNYVEYLTTNSVMIGGEVDKIISIVMVTGILALAISRARGLLEISVAEGEQVRSMARFFASEVVEQMAASEQEVTLGQGVERKAAILMMDMRGFTSLAAQLSPDEQIGLVLEYHAHMVPVIRRHNGIINRFEGDGILASFGSISLSETYARDAARAAQELVEAADQWRAARLKSGLPPIQIGIAVTTGTIVFGVIGDEQRLEYTILGDCVNLSAKLEKHTKVERVQALASATAVDQAIAQGLAAADDLVRLPRRLVEGVDETLDLVVLAT